MARAAAVVRRQIIVEAPIERAFEVFTDRFGDFKPPEHNLLGVPLAETVQHIVAGLQDTAAQDQRVRGRQQTQPARGHPVLGQDLVGLPAGPG